MVYIWTAKYLRRTANSFQVRVQTTAENFYGYLQGRDLKKKKKDHPRHPTATTVSRRVGVLSLDR